MGDTARETPWLTEGEAKRSAVRDMFADIAPSYDLVNSLMCFRMHYHWRKLAVKTIGLKKGESVLDVCCGTGDFMTPIRQAVGSEGAVTGVDFCGPMLSVAREKFSGSVSLAEADACDLPLGDAKFDAATVGWGLRNVPDLDKALREVNRILKPGGRFISVDMARPKGLTGRISEWVFHTVVPTIGRVFGKTTAYQYLPKSTLTFASREEIVTKMEAAGFIDVRTRDLFFGNICMHWGTKS